MSRRLRPAFSSAIELASLIRASVSRPFSLPYGVRPTPVIWLTEDLRFSAVARGFRPPSDGGLGRRPAILHGCRRAPADAEQPAVFVTWPLTALCQKERWPNAWSYHQEGMRDPAEGS